MARKPTLSPSRISTYLACPVKYRWSFLDPRGKFFFRSRSYFSFGTSLHNVLQRFHDSGDKGVETADQAIAALEENWITAGYSSPEEATASLAEGRDLIEQYVDSHVALGAGVQTLFTEKQFRVDLGDFVLIGRVDRIDEHEDGSLEIVDYKSGRDSTSEDELLNDLAMNCYQLMVHHHFPEKRVLSSILALRSGHKATTEPSEKLLKEFRIDLIELAEEILNREFENIKPIVKPICPHCDFLALCQRDSEFADELSLQIRQTSNNRNVTKEDM